MSDLYKYIKTEGVIVPDTQEVLDEVRQEWKDVFGNNFSVEEGTPQGRIIEMIATERKQGVASLCFIANQINPNYASGTFLDAIGSFFGVERGVERGTVVSYVSLAGVAGTEIPAGSIATDDDNNEYVLSNTVVLGANGKALGTFVNKKSGAIPCPPHTLIYPSSDITGWESVDNGSAGSIGWDTESDEEYRKRIQLAKNNTASSTIESLNGALYSINGVISSCVYENYTGANKTHADDPLIPVGETINSHSVFIVVSGGNTSGNFEQEVANAIVIKKGGGCGMVASQVYPDNVRAISVQNNGRPYTMTYNVAQPIPISVDIKVKNISYTGLNLAEDVKNIISDWFVGNVDYVNKNTIGYDISPFDLGAIVSTKLGVYVPSCLIKGGSVSEFGIDEVPIAINEIGTVDINDITVAIV